MGASEVEDAVLRWYAEHYDESTRLAATGHGRLESLRTRELIGRHMAEAPMAVLDVGGGADAAYDLTLVLGPLYHLGSRGDRVLALREAARVTRPGGSLLAAAIGRYYVLGEFALVGALTPERAPRLEHFVRTGENLHRDGFPVRRSHLWDELRDEALDAGWQDVQVLAVEGPVGYGVDLVPAERLEEVVAQSALVAQMVESGPRALDLSPHLMVTGRAR
jgi:ubiquinone/menaquinone biosynthesis C-methylase UbiE